METGLIAKATIVIDAPIGKVWDALVNPEKIKRYMFGSDVVTDWKVGSSIVWKGEWKGKAYEDKGTILKNEENRVLQYSHFSPLTGKPDAPENYHTVTIELEGEGDETTVTLSQDNNPTEDSRVHSEKMWMSMLVGLKEECERVEIGL